METEEVLLKSYGPLLTVAQLATVLNRSSESLRIALRRESDWADKINAARIKIGRRIYFRTVDLAKVFEGGSNSVTA